MKRNLLIFSVLLTLCVASFMRASEKPSGKDEKTAAAFDKGLAAILNALTQAGQEKEAESLILQSMTEVSPVSAYVQFNGKSFDVSPTDYSFDKHGEWGQWGCLGKIPQGTVKVMRLIRLTGGEERHSGVVDLVNGSLVLLSSELAASLFERMEGMLSASLLAEYKKKSKS